ncbi:MAG: lamin tail domain-containing protein [Leeuwenhoekiella sp.]
MNLRLNNYLPILASLIISLSIAPYLSAKSSHYDLVNDNSHRLLDSGDLAILRVVSTEAFDFTFVTFRDLPAGTTLYFTDCGAFQKGLTLPCAEGAIKYIVPINGLKTGEIVHFIDNPDFKTYNDSAITGKMEWDVDGDQLLIFQDMDNTNDIPAGAEPYFIYAVNLASRHFDKNSNPNDVNQTSLPFLLYDTANPRTALGLGRGNGREDAWKNSVYEGPYLFQTLEDAVQHITYSLNFHGSDDSSSEDYVSYSQAIPDRLTIGFPIRITEIMPNPKTVSDTKGEYFELYNKEDVPVDIEGWVLSDEDGDQHTIANNGKGVVIAPKDFLVLGINGDMALNGGVEVDYVYDDFRLGNYDDKIILLDKSGEEHDRVEYDLLKNITWPYRPNGQALVYVGMDDENNNHGGLWSLSSVSEGLAGDLGSPGHNGAEQILAPEIQEKITVFKDGKWTVSPDATTGDLYAIVVEGSPVLSNDVNLAGLQVRHGTSVDVGAVLTVSRHLIIKGDLTFKAGGAKRGELGVLPEDAVYYGDVVVETYHSGESAYSWVSSPVSTGRGTIFENWQEDGKFNPQYGTHITGEYGSLGTITANGFDAIPQIMPSMFYMDAEQQRLKPVDNTNSTSLSAGESFMMLIRGDRTVDLSKAGEEGHQATTLRTRGSLQRGDVVQEIAAFADVDNEGHTRNLAQFGNPYASTISAKRLLATPENKNINPNFYYVLDPTLGNGEGQGAYVAIAAQNGASAFAYTGAGRILPGRAFQVEILTDNVDTALVFKEDHKTPGDTAGVSDGQNKVLTVVAQLFTKGNFDAGKKPQDGVLICFGEKYKNERTALDAAKLFNFDESIATVQDDDILAIDHRSLPKAGDVIDFYGVNYTSSQYVLKIIASAFEGVQPILYDAFTGERTALEAGDNLIDFQITEDENSRSPNRFQLQFDNILNVASHQLEGTSVYPNPVVGDQLIISVPDAIGNAVKVAVVDVSGRTVHQEELTAIEPAITLSTKAYLSSGVYLVHLETSGMTAVHKIIKQ